MKRFLLFLLIFLIITLQVSFVNFFKIKGIGPDLILIILLIWTIEKGFENSWPAVLIIGLIIDVLSGLPFGLVSLSLISVVFLIDWLKKKIFSQKGFWLVLILITIGTIFHNLFLIIFGGLIQKGLVFNFYHLLIEIFYNLFIVILFYGIKKIFC